MVTSCKLIDRDFYTLVHDILDHGDVRKLAHINHHGESILHHSLKVALLSWRWGKRFGLDTTSLARGALLHDFFLYDWSTVKINPNRRFYEIHKMHGFVHPLVALNNAQERFHLNKLERDIIRRHMFPLTLIPPRYRESWLVMIVDKLVAIGEIPQYIQYLREKRRTL